MILVVAVLATGCVNAHTQHSARPLGRGVIEGGFRTAAFYADTTDEAEDDSANLAGALPAQVNAAVDFGLHDHVDVGGEVGVVGAELHVKVGFGGEAPAGVAAAVMASGHHGAGGMGGEIVGLVTAGQITGVGFWGQHDPDDEAIGVYARYGGGVGFRIPSLGLRFGLEAQRWASPSPATVFLLQGGWWMSSARTTDAGD